MRVLAEVSAGTSHVQVRIDDDPDSKHFTSMNVYHVGEAAPTGRLIGNNKEAVVLLAKLLELVP